MLPPGNEGCLTHCGCDTRYSSITGLWKGAVFQPSNHAKRGRGSLPEDRPKRRSISYFLASGKNFSGSTRWSRM
jgi:hypothetical protein